MSISLRWFTLISSIEMKRDNKSLKKTINKCLKQAAVISNEIFNSFKKLYFDIRINEEDKRSFNSLSLPIYQKLIDLSLKRFKNEEGKDLAIAVDTELRPFLRSCGNSLDDKEIEFMLHLIENYETLNKGKVTREQLYDIWGGIIYLSTQQPDSIMNYVFDHYYSKQGDLERDYGHKMLSLDKLKDFIDTYEEYFTQEQKEFIYDECKFQYMGNEFSQDAFNVLILGTRRYYPY